MHSTIVTTDQLRKELKQRILPEFFDTLSIGDKVVLCRHTKHIDKSLVKQQAEILSISDSTMQLLTDNCIKTITFNDFGYHNKVYETTSLARIITFLQVDDSHKVINYQWSS
jgi:hypothetical protein